ncbi:MAG: hypothetical protein EBZ98_05350, partial [Actinobacteria bacterium]|nr:hypothetical protein [Actinomycetota bacterium]
MCRCRCIDTDATTTTSPTTPTRWSATNGASTRSTRGAAREHTEHPARLAGHRREQRHEGSLELAKRLVELAKEGGADAAKFQTYKADTLASRHSPAYWDTTKEPTLSQFELFKKYDAFGPAEYQALAEHSKQVGIDFVSTPFDDAAVDLLAPLVPFFKVASADLTNTPLLRRVARTKKPVVLSVGASTIEEIDGALTTLRAAGARDIALLHCILNYP